MKRVMLVFQRDFREIRSMTAFRIMVIIAAVITIGATAGISIAIHLQSWYGDPEAMPMLEFITGLIVYFIPLLVLIAFIWAFASYPVIREKVNGGIECLLATPLTPGTLLSGKSLAVFLPGYVLSLISLIVLILVINLAVFLPGWDMFVLPWPALILGLLVNPLFFFAILTLTIVLSLAGNPDSAVAPSLLTGFGLMIGMPLGLTAGAFDITSWSFTGWYLLVTVAAWAIVLFLVGRLTRQKIVLSAKGS